MPIWPLGFPSGVSASRNPSTPVETEMRPTRAAINGAQPYQYPNPFSCGSYNNQTPRWACYTYTGSATLSFTRPTAKLTLARAGSGPVSSTTPVTFTAPGANWIRS